MLGFLLFSFFFFPTRFFLGSLDYFKLYGFADCESKTSQLRATIINLLQVSTLLMYVLLMTFSSACFYLHLLLIETSVLVYI